MTAEDYAKDVTKSAGIHRGHPDEKVVHDTIYGIMGKYGTVTEDSLMRYGRQIENKLYTNTDAHLARRVIPHLSSVLKK